MIGGYLLVLISLGYLLLLFAVAHWGDRRAAAGRSPGANPLVYSLSIAVYCTSWTFYGSVGRAASAGVAFLPIYLGPTLMMALSGVVLAKMLRIGKTHRITSIADFISARYGKSQMLAGLVAVIAVVGIMPYISLQLKAVSDTFSTMVIFPDEEVDDLLPLQLLVALVLAAFSVLFGTRHMDASEHHEGMVLAIAFESVVKLLAFLAVGVFVTFGLYDGFGDLFRAAAARPDLKHLLTLRSPDYGDWVATTGLAMTAFVCLPRQFQICVVENVDERHLRRAVWLFPLYLLAINLFVLPIALAGRMTFLEGGMDPDAYVLDLPLAHGQAALAVFAFLGGLSAAASMVIVETVALSTMVCNDLVMPILLRVKSLRMAERQDVSRLLLLIRRCTIIGIMLLGYFYVRLIGDSYALASIGMVSFCAAAQFAPALLGGIWWKGGTRAGALAGLVAGFTVWVYTLLLPSFALSGWLPPGFVDNGLFGVAALKPYALFGLDGMGSITHALVWSGLANIGFYVGVSLLTDQTALERIQAALFVDAFKDGARPGSHFWRGQASVSELKALCARFLGAERTDKAFRDAHLEGSADAELVTLAERLLGGAIGAASARVMVASVAKGELVGLEEVMEILDEASQVIAYSQRLEAKSRELEDKSRELESANAQLKELDRLKDDFISTVTHELRTPLTSIRSFTEILHDNPNLDEPQRREFLSIVIAESERLTRLINQVLDMARMESGRLQWCMEELDARQVVDEAARATGQLFKDKAVALSVALPAAPIPLWTDRDKLMQVVINLLSNAVKFVEPGTGAVTVSMIDAGDGVEVEVRDNGPGVPEAARAMIFERFHQVGDTLTAKPPGSGLGLAISKGIVEHLGGRIWLANGEQPGAVFRFFVPRQRAKQAAQ